MERSQTFDPTMRKGKVIMAGSNLSDKKILVVDDESVVLAVLEEEILGGVREKNF